jgi:hypothetical protein
MFFTRSSCSRHLKEAPLSLKKSLRRSNKIVEGEVDEEMVYRSKSLTLLAPCSLYSALETLKVALVCFIKDKGVEEGVEGIG